MILGSSLRARSPEETLALARPLARSLGVTRVTDVTRLDRVGVPVFVSVRPGAAPGSLCVNAGKGSTAIEAEVGATMEAIEFALAEPGRSRVRVAKKRARDVLDGRKRAGAILDLCPVLGRAVRLDAPMDVVSAEEITTGARAFVPAELVFLPFPRGSIFGASSNGLASGNTLREATVHALAELIERDVRSFQAVRDTSVRVDLSTASGPARGMIDAIGEAGLELHVRAADNVFGVPYFAATLHDPGAWSPHLVNGGFGCHPHRGIALVRAISEAVQSRLSYIHGGRDDLVERHDRFRRFGVARKRAYVERVVARAARGVAVPLGQVADLSALRTIDGCERALLERLAAAGMPRAYRVAFTAPDDPLQVVRVVVPRLELFTETLHRVGLRLRDHVKEGACPS